MTIQEICNMLRAELLDRHYAYGFVLNGVRHCPDMENGFDQAFDHLLKTEYRVQHPHTTMQERTGTCVDAVLVMQLLLEQRGIPCKIWLQHNRLKNRVHTILTFCAEGKTVYLELTPQSSKAWYGHEIVYDSEQAFLQAQGGGDIDLSDITHSLEPNEQPACMLAKLGVNP